MGGWGERWIAAHSPVHVNSTRERVGEEEETSGGDGSLQSDKGKIL